MRWLYLSLLLAACTTFDKADDAGSRDADVSDAADSAVIDTNLDVADAGPDAVDTGVDPVDVGVDVGPGPCTGVSHNGLLSPDFDPDTPSATYTLVVPFARLRARFEHVDAMGRPCETPTNPDGALHFLDDGSFVPVSGAELRYESFAVGVEVDSPIEDADAFFVDTWREGQFGSSLSAEGNRIAVGAPLDGRRRSGFNLVEELGVDRAGAVHIFSVMSGRFLREAFINSTEPRPRGDFGRSVHFADGYLAVAAPDELAYDDAYGRVHVFERQDDWTEQGIVPRPLSGRILQHARTRDGLVYLGVPEAHVVGGGTRGVVRIYQHDDSWTETSDIVPPGLPRDEEFGTQFEVAGDVMLVQESDTRPARLHLFRHDGEAWQHQAEMPLPNEDALFATDGLYAAIANENNTTLYRLDANTFDVVAILGVSSRGTESIAVRDGRIALGRPASTSPPAAALVITGTLELETEVLSLRQGLLSRRDAGDSFGAAVAFTESAGLVVGAPRLAGPGPEVGAIFLFR